MLSNFLDENTVKLVLQLGSCFISLHYLESFVIVGFSGRGVFKIQFCSDAQVFFFNSYKTQQRAYKTLTKF